ncbi:hypothetical protein PSEUDO9AZ_10352 [Pseudomonas sp. 9AZ]|nr:hypothetical protein PSEUDO9AZ_10352 [Pseudomonas sp. 9AZ]
MKSPIAISPDDKSHSCFKLTGSQGGVREPSPSPVCLFLNERTHIVWNVVWADSLP